MVKVNQDKESWEAGYDAGRCRESSTPPEGVEVLGWYSGYIEGKADPIILPVEGSPATRPQDKIGEKSP